VLVAVLGVTGLLTALPTPADRWQDLPFPPPPVGPIVPAGTLAGQVGVAARASAGQLVVQLSTPDLAPGEASTGGQEYRLAAAVADPGGRARALPLRGCGPGCFLAAHQWREGTSRLTLTAAAPGWEGGQATLAVPWPPRPESRALRRVVAAMRAVPEFTLHELVTSDTTRGLGMPVTVRLSGTRFLASEPYGSGVAPVTTRLGSAGGRTRLALAYPAENIQIELTVAADGRILRETLAAPQHLVTRSFVYPRGP